MKLSSALRALTASALFVSLLCAANLALATPEAAAFFKSETAKWNRVIEAANIRLD